MEVSLPPDALDRIRKLEAQVAELTRPKNVDPGSVFGLSDVDTTAPTDGQVLTYNRSSGKWRAADTYLPGFVGEVVFSARSAAPPGRWLAANGGAASRTTYAELFAAIGTTYGAGDGSSTFNLPNLSGRMIIGVGTDSLGATGGARTHTLTTGEIPSHSHGQVVTAGFSGGSGVRTDYDTDFSGASSFDQGVSTGGTGGGGAHNNLPPYLALWGYIRY